MINGPDKLLPAVTEEGYIRPCRNTGSNTTPPPCRILRSYAGRTDKPEQAPRPEKKANAIVAFNDYVALDAVQFALKKEYKVNKDLTLSATPNLAHQPLYVFRLSPPLNNSPISRAARDRGTAGIIVFGPPQDTPYLPVIGRRSPWNRS